MTTHEFNNDSDQAERWRVERDTYLTRAQSDADLTSQGRFKKEIATRVTGVPSYPQLPASSPWSNAFDQNVELPLGYAVDAMPQEIQEPTPSVASAAGVGSDGPAALPSVVNLAATEAKSLTGSPTIKRKVW
jgi:hypothetical protein